MGAIWTSRTRSRQPQGAVGANASSDNWSFLWSAVTPRVSVTPGSNPTNLPTGAVVVNGPGPVVMLDGQSVSGQTQFVQPLPTTTYSFAAVIAPLRANSGGWPLRTSGGDGFRLNVITTGGGYYIEVIHSGVTAMTNVVFVTTEFDSRPYTVIGTYDGTTGKLWVKAPSGEIKTSVATGAMASATGYLEVVGTTTAGTAMVALSLRSIPDARAVTLLANPWQLFAPQRTARIYSFPTAGGAAALEGSLAASATVSAALTSAIRPAASVAASATVAAALSTSIRPAASVAASATVTAALTTAIRFASSVSASANVAGDISGAAALASTVSASAIVTGALSTAIRLNASVIGAATVAGVLAEPGAAAALEAAIYGYATVSANLTGGTSTIWTPASASSGTWTPASAAGGTWVAQ